MNFAGWRPGSSYVRQGGGGVDGPLCSHKGRGGAGSRVLAIRACRSLGAVQHSSDGDCVHALRWRGTMLADSKRAPERASLTTHPVRCPPVLPVVS